jgi:hypothetical protein
MTSPPGIYPGSCHCGGIAFRYRTAQPPGEWSIRACQCSFCRAHGALSTSDPAGKIEFREVGDGAFNRYRFGLRMTDFLLCGKCGVYIGAVMETPNGSFGIINVNALRPKPTTIAGTMPMEYGSESPEQRASRREKRWSSVVWTGSSGQGRWDPRLRGDDGRGIARLCRSAPGRDALLPGHESVAPRCAPTRSVSTPQAAEGIDLKRFKPDPRRASA